MIILMVAFPRKPVSTFPAIFLIDLKVSLFPAFLSLFSPQAGGYPLHPYIHVL